MNSKPKWPPIKLAEFNEDEDGNFHFEFDFEKDFEEWFKKDQGLKRWSTKRFNEWVMENISELLSEQGLL